MDVVNLHKNLYTFIFVIIPGSIYLNRYRKKSPLKVIISFFATEISPYVLIAYFSGIPLYLSFLYTFIMYCFYEIGYAHNDFKELMSEDGSTRRPYIKKINYKMFIIIRFIMSFFILVICIFKYKFISIGIALGLLIILSLFIIHNSLRKSEHRVATFIFLNSSKISIRLSGMDPYLIYYLLGSVPFLMIKLIHYLGEKKIVHFPQRALPSIAGSVYAGFFGLFLLSDYRLAAVAACYFPVQNKDLVIKCLKLLHKSLRHQSWA